MPANVWDTGVGSDGDAVNEIGRREVAVLECGSPKSVVSNHLSIKLANGT